MIKLFVFKVNEVKFALSIDGIISICDGKDIEISDIPKEKGYIRGISYIRDEVYTVIDMSYYLYKRYTNGKIYILVMLGNKLYALVVDEVDGIIEVTEESKIEVSSVIKDSKILYHIYRNKEIISILNIKELGD